MYLCFTVTFPLNAVKEKPWEGEVADAMTVTHLFCKKCQVASACVLDSVVLLEYTDALFFILQISHHGKP